MSVHRTDTEGMVGVHSGVWPSHEKECSHAICSDMNGPRDHQTKWSKSDRDGEGFYDIAYMRSLKKLIQMSLFIK